LILDALVGDGIGVEELIVDSVKPLLAERYQKLPYRHIGDPAGTTREQSSIHQSAVRVIKKELGGAWRSGPVRLSERIDPLRAVLRRNVGGRGLIQVDRDRAAAVWFALRGGWHFNVTRTGIISGEPVKNMSSHPGDAMGYGASVLFPLGKLRKNKSKGTVPQHAGYFGNAGRSRNKPLGFERPHVIIPNHGDILEKGK
jgi:RNase P/RNase MRP subunit POP5